MRPVSQTCGIPHAAGIACGPNGARAIGSVKPADEPARHHWVYLDLSFFSPWPASNWFPPNDTGNNGGVSPRMNASAANDCRAIHCRERGTPHLARMIATHMPNRGARCFSRFVYLPALTERKFEHLLLAKMAARLAMPELDRL